MRDGDPMARQVVRHCCKTRHCCRDGSCLKVSVESPGGAQMVDDPRTWRESTDPDVLAQRQEILAKMADEMDLPYDIQKAGEAGLNHWNAFAPERGPGDLTQAELDAMYAAKLEGKLILTPAQEERREELVNEIAEKMGVDNETLTTDAMTELNGGWCAPSRCAVGVCTTDAEHEEGCEGPGWAYARLRIGGGMLMLPEITVNRGGIRFQRFPVHTTVIKTGFREFYVTVRVTGQDNADRIGPFGKRKRAENAKKVIDTMTRMLDDMHRQERQMTA